jgi:hypothetical protein
METKDWPAKSTPKALLIGHDPTLQNSKDRAATALYANLFFDPPFGKGPVLRKYGLAKASFDQITYLTYGKIAPEKVYVTNLCNSALPHAPVGKTVYIPEGKAQEGLENIRRILESNPSIEFVFPMSLQVNYWLQKLGFYSSGDDFLALSEPKDIGIQHKLPYYLPRKSGSFTLICGRIFETFDGKHKVIPILHSKNYPLKGRFSETYGPKYVQIRNYYNSVNEQPEFSK